MIDKYTYLTELQVSDIYYIIHCLHSSKAITINNEDELNNELENILSEYVNEDEDEE